jgi:transcription factor E
MLKNLLKEVVALVAGKQAEEIVDLLDTQNYINEFIIAKKLNLTINQTRNILYKISDYGLVSSIRKKDKRKGWYTYFWKIEILKSLEFLKENLLKKIDNVEHQIKSRETKRFYFCERCHIELTEENALINNFTCNECGSTLSLRDNTKLAKDLRRGKEKLEKDLKVVDEEVLREKGKEDKKKAKEMKKEEKRVNLNKAELRKRRKRENIINKRISGKKQKIPNKIQKKKENKKTRNIKKNRERNSSKLGRVKGKKRR